MRNQPAVKDEPWFYTLFVKHPTLYLPFLEEMNSKALEETRALSVLFRKLGVRKYPNILDYSCGIGRHAINLGKRGFRVVGIDPSPFFINTAMDSLTQEDKPIRKKVRFYTCDLKSVTECLVQNSARGFNVIINMWHSLGYGTVGDDIEIFQQVREVASSGCVLILQTENKEWRIRHFQPQVIHDFEKVLVQETWKYNSIKGIFESTSDFYEKDRSLDLHLVLHLETTMILYSIHELIEVLSKSGWDYVESYGNLFSLTPVNFDSETIVTVFKKNS